MGVRVMGRRIRIPFSPRRTLRPRPCQARYPFTAWASGQASAIRSWFPRL